MSLDRQTPENLSLDTSASSSTYRDVRVINAEIEKAKKILEDKKNLEDLTVEEITKLGITLIENNDNAESEELLNLVINRVKNQDTSDALRMRAESEHGLANNQREKSQDEMAIAGYHRALLFLEQSYNKGLEENTYYNVYYRIGKDLGIGYLKVDRFQAAADVFRKEIAVAEKSKNTGGIPSVTSYCGLALVSTKASPEMIAEGFALLYKARTLYPSSQHRTSLDYASNWYHTGLAYERVGEYIEAYSQYRTALELRLYIIAQDQQDKVYRYSRVGDVYAGLGRVSLQLVPQYREEAKKYLDQALEAYQALKAEKKAKEIQDLLLTFSVSSPAKERKEIPVTQTKAGAFQQPFVPPLGSDPQKVSEILRPKQ